MSEIELSELRKFVDREFTAFAEKEGRVVNPTARSAIDTRLAGRIFEETKDGRMFVIVPGERALDAFVKETGIAYETSLLQISIRPDKNNIMTLWHAYVAWVHECVTAKDALRTLGVE